MTNVASRSRYDVIVPKPPPATSTHSTPAHIKTISGDGPHEPEIPVDINADRQRSLPIVCDRAQCDAGAGAAVQPNHYRNRGERRRRGGELLRRYNDAPDAQRLGRDRQAHTGRNAVEYEGE